MRLNVAVIGAGISGISLARMIGQDANVTVFEQKDKIGGLISCDTVNGFLYHKVGGHVFNSKNQNVLNWFWQFFNQEEEFIKAKRLAKVFINDSFVGYPIEDHLFQFNIDIISDVVNDLLESNSEYKADNFESFLINSFGNTLYNLYFKPYNEKIWNVDLSQVPLDWLEGKLPMPKLREILLNNILRREEANMVHSFFYYPKKGGSQFIIDRLAEGVSCINGFSVNKITIINSKIFVNDLGPFDKLVYTGDVRKLLDYLNDSINLNIDKDQLKSLKSNGTTNVLCTCDSNPLSWLYIPEKKYKAHRIIYTGNFSESNNGTNLVSSCTVEFSNFTSLEDAKEEITKLPGNLKLLAYNYEPNSYVIQEKGTRELINEFKKDLKPNNIYLVGRFAEWEYYNMDKAIESSLLLAKDLIYN